jgi:hypothetical protein
VPQGRAQQGRLDTVVPHRQVTAPPDAGDGPPVAVFDPVGCNESESTVVAARDDHIFDTGPVSVCQRHLKSGREVIKTMRPGAAVEFASRSRVGAIMIASSPAARSETQDGNDSEGGADDRFLCPTRAPKTLIWMAHRHAECA